MTTDTLKEESRKGQVRYRLYGIYGAGENKGDEPMVHSFSLDEIRKNEEILKLEEHIAILKQAQAVLHQHANAPDLSDFIKGLNERRDQTILKIVKGHLNHS